MHTHKLQTLPRLRLLAFSLLLFGSFAFWLFAVAALLRPAVLQSKLSFFATFLSAVCFCLPCPFACSTLNNETCLRSEPEAADQRPEAEADGRRAEGEERRPKVVKSARLELRKNARHVSASSKGLSLLR